MKERGTLENTKNKFSNFQISMFYIQ